MKRTVRVVKEFEYEIEIDDSILNQDFVDEFESCFWKIDGYTLQDKLGKLFELAASQLANGEKNFIEGIGGCGSAITAQHRRNSGQDVVVVWDCTYDDIETEIVE